MSDAKRKSVKLKPRPVEEIQEDSADVNLPPPRDIYESVVRDLGFDPLREMAARPS